MHPDAQIRLITPADDPAVAAVIRAVMPEFGASGPGFALSDPEVDAMSGAYAAPRAAYFVLVQAGTVVGGAGIGPLAEGASSVCELRKMYLLRAGRGQGSGVALLQHCLRAARGFGYQTCYLETLTGMDGAQRLYAKAGFLPLAAPLGATGHFRCDRWYALAL